MANARQELEELAYIFYERSGKVDGNDLDNWLKAERFVSVWRGRGKTGEYYPAAEEKGGGLYRAKGQTVGTQPGSR